MAKSFLFFSVSSTSGAASSTDSVSNMWLSAHNVYRSAHGVPNLKWSEAVAYEAQKLVDNGVYEHSQSYELAPPAGPAGENIASGYGSVSAVVDGWYSEVSDCSGYWPGCEHPTAMIGHFTAMIWKGAKELGCGQGTLANGRPFHVCHYKGDDTLNCNTPNMQGCYSSNVPPPSRSTSQRGGGAAPVPPPPPAPSSTCGNIATDADCDGWVGAGYCSQSSQYYPHMKTNCKKGCGFCAPVEPCGNIGEDAHCDAWVSAGYCSQSSEYYPHMKTNCKKGCGFCAPVEPPSSNCVQLGSLPTCQSDQKGSQCLETAQCAASAYCCPYMKKCITSGMSCYYPIANCQPPCHTVDGCNCPGTADSPLNYPSGWQLRTCASQKTEL